MAAISAWLMRGEFKSVKVYITTKERISRLVLAGFFNFFTYHCLSPVAFEARHLYNLYLQIHVTMQSLHTTCGILAIYTLRFHPMWLKFYG
jgi:hypothetical protein